MHILVLMMNKLLKADKMASWLSFDIQVKYQLLKKYDIDSKVSFQERKT